MINIRKSFVCDWSCFACLFSSFSTCLFLLIMMIFFTVVVIINIMILIPLSFSSQIICTHKHNTTQHTFSLIPCTARRTSAMMINIINSIPSSIPLSFSYPSLSRFAFLSVPIFVDVLFMRVCLCIPFYFFFFSSMFKQLLCCCYYFY